MNNKATPPNNDKINIIDAALKYANRGWAVLPIHTPGANGSCSCGRSDCDSPGKHPRTMNGLRDATTDEATIKKWFNRWPTANIGIATGAESGLVVIDVDGDEGSESWHELQSRHGTLPDTITAKTARGFHIYLKHPGGYVKPSASAVGKGIDVRGDGSYIVAPPSTHASGKQYMWELSGNPDEVELADMPEWLVESIRAPRNETSPIPEVIKEGSRNETLTSLAGSLRHRGMPEGVILEVLLTVNKRHCAPPLPEQEIKSIARSVGRYHPLFTTSPSFNNMCDMMKLRVSRLSDGSEPEPMRFLLEDFIPEGYPTMLYGDGGQGKSLLALHLGCSVAAGVPFLGKTVVKGNVLYCDFELDEREQKRRAYKAARGLGLARPPEGLLYFSPSMQEGSVTDLSAIIKKLAEVVKDNDIALTIVDSFGAAVAGDPESARDVTAFFRKLRQLKTVLILDHQAKGGENYKGKTAFGSVYKGNLSRNVWQLQRMETSAVEGPAKLALYHKKSNFGPLRETIYLKATFGSSFMLELTEPDDGFMEALTTKEKVLRGFIGLGEATAEEVAEYIGENSGTVRNKITELKKEGKLRPTGEKRDKAPVYEPTVTTSHTYSDYDGDEGAVVPQP